MTDDDMGPIWHEIGPRCWRGLHGGYDVKMAAQFERGLWLGEAWENGSIPSNTRRVEPDADVEVVKRRVEAAAAELLAEIAARRAREK